MSPCGQVERRFLKYARYEYAGGASLSTRDTNTQVRVCPHPPLPARTRNPPVPTHVSHTCPGPSAALGPWSDARSLPSMYRPPCQNTTRARIPCTYLIAVMRGCRYAQNVHASFIILPQILGSQTPEKDSGRRGPHTQTSKPRQVAKNRRQVAKKQAKSKIEPPFQ